MRKWLAVFFLLVGCQNVWALQASDILSRARVYLKDQSTVPVRQTFSDATLLQYLSDGQREANSFGWLLQSSTTFQLTAGTTEYSLPVDFMFTNRVTYNGQKITQTSFDQLDSGSLGWSQASGQPQQYFIDPYSPTPQVGFVPAPAVGSTGTIVIQYVQQTTDITSTSVTPFNGWITLTPYHSGLVDYVVCRAWQTLEEMDLAQPFCDRWQLYVGAMRTGQLRTPDFNPGAGGRRNQ